MDCGDGSTNAIDWLNQIDQLIGLDEQQQRARMEYKGARVVPTARGNVVHSPCPFCSWLGHPRVVATQ